MEEEKLPLPTGVHPKHGSWYYVERNQWRKLCRISEGRPRLYARLHEVTGGVEGMCWHAILSYVRHGMADLSPATQKKYGVTALRMLHHFGHFACEEVEETHAKQFLKYHRERGTPTQGNRDKAFMSSVFEYAMGEGWSPRNPFRGVRRNRERPAKHYIEHATLTAQIDRAPPALQSLLAVAYLTGMRQTDLRLLRKANVFPTRIEWTESKTGKENSALISPTLRLFLDMAMDRSKTDFVFVSAEGLPWTVWGLQSALRRFGAGFKFRELRAKAQTDSPAKNILGHTGQLLERYTRRRKLDVVK
jgi:integrase